MLALTILGNNSAIPAHGRHPTAQIVTIDEHLLLIDCGEGTQIQIINYKIRRNKIDYIFISHLHGDHYFGLVGLLNSFSLLGRTQPLHLFGPEPLIDILNLQFKHADNHPSYDLQFYPLKNEGLILEETKFKVFCFPVYHRIKCWGFLIKEKRNPRKIIASKVEEFNIPHFMIEKLQHGEDFMTEKGELVPNSALTIPNTPTKSYAFCADTMYNERIIDVVKNVDLLYHESTYTHHFIDKARERFHSTSIQAAQIAKKAAVKRLLIGHFSSKFPELGVFEEEAKSVFENSELATEGVTYLV